MSNSRPMFWRIVRRLLTANRGRLLVILLALGAGAAVTSALLNLQIDAKRRLTTEFRAFGPNVIVAPSNSANSTNATLDESILQQIPKDLMGQRVEVRASLYVAAVSVAEGSHPVPIIVSGVLGDGISTFITGGPSAAYMSGIYTYLPKCLVGAKAYPRIRPYGKNSIHQGPVIHLVNDGKREECLSSVLPPSGGPEDDQVTLLLPVAQRLAGVPGKISLVEITAPGTPTAINNYVAGLQKKLPDTNVHGIRQFTEAEAKIYDRISGLLTATVAVVLLLTTLCIMAAMTNVAMERKNDVGLMKAIGGATRRVLRLFLAEAAVLGLIGGVLGAAAGIALSIGLGKAVFGVAAQPRLIVYPISVTLTILVAVAGAYPLRRLASIRPASVFRGE
jgi:putative ABC transport system permease protein